MYTVYIITNKNHTVLYTGVTFDIVARMIEHKEKIFEKSFTAKYNCHKLLYFEHWEDRNDAYHREAQIKRYRRAWKMNLINKNNPFWKDLNEEIFRNFYDS